MAEPAYEQPASGSHDQFRGYRDVASDPRELRTARANGMAAALLVAAIIVAVLALVLLT